MKRYIKANKTSFLITVNELFKMLDEYIQASSTLSEEYISSKDKSTVTKVMITSQFEKNLKILHKEHKRDTLKKLRDVISKLCKYEITTQYSNHRLVSQNNPNRLSDIHIDGDVILLYRYISSGMLAFDLELTNITDHKNLNNVVQRKYNSISNNLPYSDS